MTQTSKDNSVSDQRQGGPDASKPSGHVAVLQRIIARSQKNAPPDQKVEDKAATQQLSVDRLIGTALGRTAEKLYALPIFVQSIDLATATLAELPEVLPEQGLLAVVEGRAAAMGVVALSPTFVASVIEVQAIGRISGREIRARKPTRTDATISADFVNTLLSELGKELARHTQLPTFAAFSYASFLDDPRPLMLMLDDVALTQVTLNFRIGAGGQRDGSIVIALPTPHLTDAKCRPTDKQATINAISHLQSTLSDAPPDIAVAQPGMSVSPTDGADLADGETLALALQEAPVHVVGILCRKKVSLGSLRNLVPGTLIPLPAGALNDARLETRQGQLLARGRLGEADGYHAIRLRATESPDQSNRVMRQQATANAQPTPAAPDFPHVDITQPDAFRTPPLDHGPAEVTSLPPTNGAAAFDISVPHPSHE